MKKSILILLQIVLFFAYSQADELVPIPTLTRQVTDVAGILEEGEIIAIESIIKSLDTVYTSQVVVLIIATTGSESIEEYSMRVAEEWKIGSKENDDGVILLIAKNDRKVRIEVGYGLEGTITDAYANRIINTLIVPQFKNGDFYYGIYFGTEEIINLITGKSTFTTDYEAKIYLLIEENKNEIEKESLNDKYPALITILMIIGFIGPIFFIFVIRLKIYWSLIVLGLLIALNLFIGYAWGSYVMTIALLPITLIIGIMVIVAKLFPNFFKGGGGGSYRSTGSYSGSNYGSTSYGSTSYGSTNSYGGGSSYSGGGGSFGGGGSSGSW